MPRAGSVSYAPYGATLTVTVAGLVDHTGAAQAAATVQVTAIVNKATLAPLASVTLPITLEYVAGWATAKDEYGRALFESDGNYQGQIPYTNGMRPGQVFLATIVATLPSGAVGRWRQEIAIEHG